MNEEQQRICSICNLEKSMDEFYFRKDINNYRKQCKTCVTEKGRKYYVENKEERNEYRMKNIERKRDYDKDYARKNREKRSEYMKAYRMKNIEKKRDYDKEYAQKNREKVNDYMRNRRRNDENLRLIDNTRRRINDALNGKSKSLHTKDILGIDVETYKRWIEHQMTPEMNWSNIHIDHVKPISLFDISNDDELLEAFNWKNTQPLLKEDNLSKGCKFNELDYRLQFIKACEFINSNKINLINESTLSNQSNRN